MKLFTVLFLFLATLATAEPLDTSYALPKELPAWACRTQSFEKAGRHVTTYAIYSPDRTHVITIAFVTGYSDHAISNDHFTALENSFAREGLKEVKEKKRVLIYGLPGAQITAEGVIQGRNLRGKGMILKSKESELTIMIFAVDIALEDPDFATALSGLGLAKMRNENGEVP